MGNVTDNLIKARDEILDPHDWCQGGSGWERTENDEGHRLCIEGALIDAIGLEINGSTFADLEDTLEYQAVKQAIRVVDTTGMFTNDRIYGYNDSRSHSDVMELMDVAIRIAKDAEL